MIAISEQEKYQRYLCSREWAEKRKLVITRCKGVCERCRHGRVTHIHHLTYIRKYHELPEDLQGLCTPCHEFTHGKRDRDPLLDVPLTLFGREIESVYLAGKISGDAWREEILDPHKRHDHWAVTGQDDHWFTADAVSVPGSSRKLDYRGPFWLDLLGGHGWPGDNPCEHAYGDVESCRGDGHCQYATNGAIVRQKSFLGVCRSHLIFAWIDSADCFGTLAEIAVAYAVNMQTGNGPVIAIACHPDFDERGAMWFVLEMAHINIWYRRSPREAWEELWESRS